jgi:hypothetical protein
MPSQQARKLKKQKKREQQNKRQKLADERQRRERERQRLYRLIYPEFHFDTKHGDPRFVEVVKKVLATISFEDTGIFIPGEMALYRMLKQYGASAVMHTLRAMKAECHEAGNDMGRMMELHFMFNLGQAVLNRIPESKRDAYLPFNDVMLVPHGHRIDVIFRSLLKAKGPSGTIYYSRRRPTLEIDGLPKIVAFSRHAIERICERLRPRWKISYAALGDAFAYFDQCVYFERCELYGGQLAFTFYEECKDGFVQHWYIDNVLGEENLDPRAGKPHYRVGYCPAVIEGNFVKAKSFLFPGYASTPEYDAILRCTLPGARRSEMINRTKALDADTIYGSQDMSLIKWFHDHGVPQVVHLDHPVFAPAA